MLDLRRLSILIVVFEEGSLTAAAARLYMTQSAVSQQMSILERETGTKLFRRLPRGVEATPAGDLLASRARSLLGDSLAIEQELTRFAAESQEIRLAAFVSAGVELLPQTLRAFAQRCPDVRLTVRATSGESLSLLREGQVGALLMWDYDFDPVYVDPAFVQIHLAEDPMLVVLPADHPLAAQERVELSDLAHDKWVTRSHRAVYGIEPYGKMFRMAGFEPDIAVKAVDYQSLQGLVATGMGVSLAPSLALFPHRPDVVVRPATEPSFSRAVKMWTLPEAARTRPVVDLIEVLRDAAQHLGLCVPSSTSPGATEPG